MFYKSIIKHFIWVHGCSFNIFLRVFTRKFDTFRKYFFINIYKTYLDEGGWLTIHL